MMIKIDVKVNLADDFCSVLLLSLISKNKKANLFVNH